MPIKIGLIGASTDASRSWGTRAHIPALTHLPQFDLAAVCTSRAETARAVAEMFDIRSAWHDVGEMIARADIDAVAISVRTPLHRQMIQLALKAGKHIYCEWPLGIDSAEARLSRDDSAQAGVVAMIGLQGARNERLRYARDLIAEGAIGRPVAVTLKLSQANFGPIETEGNAYTADIANGADILHIATAQALEAVCAVVGDIATFSATVSRQYHSFHLSDGRGPFDKTAPDHILLSGHLTSGAVFSAVVRGGVHDAVAEARLEINGTDGDMVLHADGAANIHRAPVRISVARRDAVQLTELALPDEYMLKPDGLPDGPGRYLAGNYVDFAEAIETGTQPRTSFDYAMRWHRFLDAVQSASDSGQRQTINV